MNVDINGFLQMFEEREIYLKKLKAESYETNTDTFIGRYGSIIDGMLAELAGSDKPDEDMDGISSDIATKVKSQYEKRGRIKMDVGMDLNFMLIYYFFPYLLDKKDETADRFAQIFRDRWNKVMGCNISYAPREDIAAGFKKKLFGFF